MAIIFNKTIDFDKWVLSENNLILDFYDDDVNRLPLFCNVTYNGDDLQQLFPHPNGSFYTNLTDYLSSYINDYKDDIDYTTLTNTDINSFVFDWSKIYLNEDLVFTVFFNDESTEVFTYTPHIILGTEDIINFKKGGTINDLSNYVLSPLKKESNNRFYLRYWEGYPFDFGYTKAIPLSVTPQKIKNNTTGVYSENINFNNDVSRVFISNGDTNTTLEDHLPLMLGYNELELNNEIFIELWKEDSTCGNYIKWLNQYGGYNYWLFNARAEDVITSDDLGVINNDFNNMDSTVSVAKSLGRQTARQLNVLAEGLSEQDMNVLKGVMDSPKIYLFTGERFSVNSFSNWIEIQLSNKEQVVKDFKNNIPEVLLNFDIPTIKNIRL